MPSNQKNRRGGELYTFGKDRIALITGGASGTGLGTAKRLAQVGTKVAIADVNKESLEHATTHGETISFLPLMMDVSLAKEVQAGVERVVE